MNRRAIYIILYVSVSFLLSSCDGYAQRAVDTTKVILHKCTSLMKEEEVREIVEMKVIKIVDGDTFDGLTKENKQVRIRLAAFDAPEKGQPYGKNAQKKLSELILGKNVIVVMSGKQHYSRMIATVYIQDSLNVVEEMLKSGMGWHFSRFDDSECYQQLEDEARAAQVGLWHKDAHTPIAPWDWRKMSKEERDLYR